MFIPYPAGSYDRAWRYAGTGLVTNDTTTNEPFYGCGDGLQCLRFRKPNVICLPSRAVVCDSHLVYPPPPLLLTCLPDCSSHLARRPSHQVWRLALVRVVSA